MSTTFWKNRNVLVTGATGLLGSWLTSTLCERGARAVILERDVVPRSNFYLLGLQHKVETVSGQLEDYFAVERTLSEYEIEICFHMAAQAIVTTANRSPLSTFESNIRGTWNLLEAARHSSLLKRLVVCSSDKAYGDHDKLPYTEDFPLKPRHPYDASKACVDLLAQSYVHTFKLPLTISRCGNLYGGGDYNFSRIIPGTIASILKKEDPVIRSDGKFLRDYFYIEDAVDAFLTLAERMDQPGVGGEAFNFGTETPTSVLDVVDLILKHMDAKKKLRPKILNDAGGEIRNQYLSCEKARKRLGWKPRHSLEEGLQKTIEWYRKNLTF